MKRPHRFGLTLLLLAGLATACHPEDDGGEPSDATVPDTSVFDTPAPSGNLSCHLGFDGVPLGDPCVSCLTSLCGNELQAAFGTRGLPTQPGGSCRAFLACLDVCDCDNDDCFTDCIGEMDTTCQTDLAAVQQCQEDDCGENCDFDPSESDGDFCNEPVGVVASGMAPVEATLSGADRLGGPLADAYFDVYTVTTSPTGRLTVGMTSDTLDCYLFAFDSECSELDSDDDGGEGLNSLLELPNNTTFVIATSLNGDATGAYVLTVSAE